MNGFFWVLVSLASGRVSGVFPLVRGSPAGRAWASAGGGRGTLGGGPGSRGSGGRRAAAESRAGRWQPKGSSRAGE